MSQENRVAVFFDYENIVYSLRNRFEQKANFEALINKAKEYGRVVDARAFADWSLPYMSSALMYALQASGFDLIFVPTGSTQSNAPRKNVADLYMAIHIMDVLHERPEIDTFILLTGDRDFMPLVNHLKRHGKRVVAIGVDGSSSYYLTQSVDDFYYYSEVEEIFEEQPRQPKGRPTNIYDAVVQAVQIVSEQGKSPRLTNLKPIMIDLLSGFDEKEYSDSHGRRFQKFKDFVLEAQRRGLVRMVRNGNAYDVYLYDEKVPQSTQQSAQQPAAKEQPTTPRLTLKAALDLLVQAVTEAERDNRSSHASAIKSRLTQLHPGFNEQDIAAANGQTFSRFSEFLQAAADKGLVEVKGNQVRPLQDQPAQVEAAAVDVPVEAEQLTGIAAREAILSGLRGYDNYPTSFLSLASFVHRHNDSNGVSVDESLARDLMTEAVQINLLQQIVLPDGRRQYQLHEEGDVTQRYLRQLPIVEEEAAVEPQQQEQPETQETEPEPGPTIFHTLATAVRTILQEGKDPVLPRVKSMLGKILGSFDERNFEDSEGNHFTKFKDFVLEGERRGLVRLKVEGTVNRVFLPEDGDAAQSDEQEATSVVDGDDNLAEAVQDALDEQESDDYGDYQRLDEEQQRQLIVDSLRSFEGYPAPFMALLSHCRNIRDARTVYLPNSDLRDLLSEAAHLGVANTVSERSARPTLYTFTDDDALIASYLQPEEETVEEEQPQVDQPAAEAAPEPQAADEAPQQSVAKVDEHQLRQLVVDAIRSYDAYPAQFMKLFDHVLAARDAAELQIDKERVREALSESTREGALHISSPRGKRPTLYSLSDDEANFERYLGGKAPAAAAEAPQAPQADEIVSEDAADAVAEATVGEEESATPEREIYGLLSEAVAALEAEEKSTTLGTVKRRMVQIDANFDEKKHSSAAGKKFSRFKDFLLEAERLGHVELTGSGNRTRVQIATGEPQISGHADVTTTDEVEEAVADLQPGPATAEDTGAEAGSEQPFPETVESELPTAEVSVESETDDDAASEEAQTDAPAAGEPRTDLEKAFALLSQAVKQQIADKRSHRLSAVRSRMVRIDPNFDVKSLEDSTGKPFKSLSAFVKAAAERDYVRTEGSGIRLEVFPSG